MTPNRWQQINNLFQTAVELLPERRAAFLDEACTTDEMLRIEVETLLASDESGWKLIEKPALEVAAPLLADERAQLVAGQQISHYEIIDMIGRGGMGEVYLAKDLKLNRRIALKLLPTDYTRDKDRLRRFQREAQAASALNHPNVLTIHETGQFQDQQFIATEFVDGETLRQRMKRGPLNIGAALDVATQTASALAAAHSAGIVHRDIKPENVMLRPDGYVKVLDFGLAKLTEQRDLVTREEAVDNVDVSSGLLMGTVKYMSPEQAQGLTVDARSDIFTLGIVLYEMLTGHVPFQGKTTHDLISGITGVQPQPLRDYIPDISDELQRIITKALQKNKEARYQTAEELLIDLRKSNEGSTASTATYLIGEIRQHRAGASLALALLVIVLAAAPFAVHEFFKAMPSAFQNIKATRLTNSGDVWGPAISPDGKSVVYAKLAEGKFSLWLRTVGTATEMQIVPPIDGGFYAATFSPDGKYIAYGARPKDQPASTYVLPLSGKDATRLPLRRATKVNFSPDGRRLAYVYGNLPEGKTSLVVANADGTGEREVITWQRPNSLWNAVPPSWSPDGKKIACVGQFGSEGFPRVVEVNIETGTETTITSQKWTSMRGVTWLPDMSGLLIVASEETSAFQQIWLISYPGGAAQRVTNDTSNYVGLSLASGGASLVTTKTENPISIWVMPVKVTNSTLSVSDSLSIGADDAKQINVTNFTGTAEFEGFASLTWTPERRIVYVSEESGNADIWSMNEDGSDRRQLTDDRHWDTAPAVSPDGSYVAFMSSRGGAENIWRMDIDGGNQTQLTKKRREHSPTFSADGRFVFYVCWETGAATIWRIPLEGGEPTQVLSDLSPASSNASGSTSATDVQSRGQSAVSPDGHLIAYFASGKIWVVPVKGGQPVKTFYANGEKVRWTPDGRALTYTLTRDGVANLWVQPLTGGEPKQLTNFSSNGILMYEWSRDGKQLAVARETLTGDAVLISEVR
jgi:Tol biopolymer transport system component